MANGNIVTRVVDYLRAVFRAILGEPPEERRPAQLSRVGVQSVTGEVDERVSETCGVKATYDDSTPATGVEVVYTVVSGPVRIEGATGVSVTDVATPGEEITVETDDEGTARVNATITGEGYGVVAAELARDRNVSQFFELRSAGVTHEVIIHSDNTFPADPGEVTVQVTALDSREDPVTGADIRVEGGYGADTVVEGTVTEVGDGVYRGEFQSHTAGEWNVTAYDAETRAQSRRCIFIEPDTPTDIRFQGTTDPRREEPYGEVLLRAELVDDFGNPHDSRRIRGELAGEELAVHSYSRTEARFLVDATGYTDVDVTVTDEESDIGVTETVHFAGVWLRDPGPVFEGDTFTTPVYGVPPPDRAIDRAEIDISFDPERARFRELSQPQEGPPIETTVEAGEETITVTAELAEGDGLTAQEFPNGIHVFDVEWECIAEGECCFEAVGRMSPETPGWELCVDQKKRDKRCLCVNVVYRSGDAQALQQGEDAANEIPSIISSSDNVNRCCPVLEVQIDDCALDASQWQDVIDAIGADATINNKSEMDALFNADICQQENCINLMMLDIDWDGFDGWTYYGTPFGSNRGFGAIEPGQVGLAQNGNLGAHELGHALDLRHQGTAGDNLMSQNAPHGDALTDDQCKTVWQNLNNYPC